MADSLEDRINNSCFYGANTSYIVQLYDDYKAGKSIDPSWIDFFEKNPGFNLSREKSVEPQKELFSQKKQTVHEKEPLGCQDFLTQALYEIKDIYQKNAHLYAKTNPLSSINTAPEQNIDTLSTSLNSYLAQPLPKHFSRDYQAKTVKDFLELLNHIYAGPISIEASYLNQEQQEWCYKKLEELRTQRLTDDKKTLSWLLERLTAADGFERYLANKYPGAKRFSLEGADSLLILLEQLIKTSLEVSSTQEVVLGLTHRGRLNILVNLLGKKVSSLFAEFDGSSPHSIGTGDVKYHQGFSSELIIDDKQVHISLAFNPSHLEIIGPVVAGATLARQEADPLLNPLQVLPIIVHGDSAFCGQGVVMELFNMSKTAGYGTHGTLHLVVNNQIGFTTSNKEDVRSTRYCTDIAKMMSIPVLHVNGDDPIAVYQAALFAAQWRATFASDMIIDLLCYRRQGHNEADEPAVTQPLMYQFIRQHPTPREIFAQQLIDQGVLQNTEVQHMQLKLREMLDTGLSTHINVNDTIKSKRFLAWQSYAAQPLSNKAQTKVDKELLKKFGIELLKSLETVKLHPRVAKIYEDRAAMYADLKPLDWGAAELLAYASLMHDGYNIRLSGQDSCRGTFFHRHAKVFDQTTHLETIPFNHLSGMKGKFVAIDSLLSEEAVLAFEYGYATTQPKTLVLWEAQFGDFANGAQVVIDQFVASGEQKWMRHCALVLLLPHGYEGQGPEHSSGRIERFLQLAAQDNMRVCIPTTPAQLFHLLRLQMLAKDRHPLILFSPKSFLRHKEAVSSLDLCAEGKFQEIIAQQQHETTVSRLIYCTGKVYYDLLAHQQETKLYHIVIIRIEQLYPFPTQQIERCLVEYNLVKEIFWVQEEPKNQGAWSFINPLISALLSKNKTMQYVGRPESAAPAVGHIALHQADQELLIKKALS